MIEMQLSPGYVNDVWVTGRTNPQQEMEASLCPFLRILLAFSSSLGVFCHLFIF